jgi:cytochrome P450
MPNEDSDLFAIMVRHSDEIKAPMTRDDMLGDGVLFWTGGVDTTTNLLSNTIKWLSEHPEARDVLKDAFANDPKAVMRATEEFLRRFPSTTANSRLATRDVELGGQLIRKGDRVLMLWSAANVQPDVFDDPETVRLDRDPNRHFAFGLGIHRCAGSHLARAIFQVVLEQVLERLGDFTVVGEPEQYPSIGLNLGWIHLPIQFTPGPKRGSAFQIPEERSAS